MCTIGDRTRRHGDTPLQGQAGGRSVHGGRRRPQDLPASCCLARELAGRLDWDLGRSLAANGVLGLELERPLSTREFVMLGARKV